MGNLPPHPPHLRYGHGHQPPDEQGELARLSSALKRQVENHYCAPELDFRRILSSQSHRLVAETLRQNTTMNYLNITLPSAGTVFPGDTMDALLHFVQHNPCLETIHLRQVMHGLGFGQQQQQQQQGANANANHHHRNENMAFRILVFAARNPNVNRVRLYGLGGEFHRLVQARVAYQQTDDPHCTDPNRLCGYILPHIKELSLTQIHPAAVWEQVADPLQLKRLSLHGLTTAFDGHQVARLLQNPQSQLVEIDINCQYRQDISDTTIVPILQTLAQLGDTHSKLRRLCLSLHGCSPRGTANIIQKLARYIGDMHIHLLHLGLSDVTSALETTLSEGLMRNFTLEDVYVYGFSTTLKNTVDFITHRNKLAKLIRAPCFESVPSQEWLEKLAYVGGNRAENNMPPCNSLSLVYYALRHTTGLLCDRQTLAAMRNRRDREGNPRPLVALNNHDNNVDPDPAANNNNNNNNVDDEIAVAVASNNNHRPLFLLHAQRQQQQQRRAAVRQSLQNIRVQNMDHVQQRRHHLLVSRRLRLQQLLEHEEADEDEESSTSSSSSSSSSDDEDSSEQEELRSSDEESEQDEEEIDAAAQRRHDRSIARHLAAPNLAAVAAAARQQLSVNAAGLRRPRSVSDDDISQEEDAQPPIKKQRLLSPENVKLASACVASFVAGLSVQYLVESSSVGS